jgi:two-component system chemotaxis response regulator CheY
MPKILIVDDSETLRSQLKRTLENAKYVVVEAVDGLNGIEVFQQNQDLSMIICDVNMPRMDGLTMCERISALEGVKKVPIFMLTTESNAEMKARGKSVGVTAWVTKPYTEDRLLSALAKIISS